MISVPRKASPRRRPNRVRLVELDGTPATPAPAESWPAWTDHWYWECGESPHDLASHVTIPLPEPDASDGESGWAAMMAEASAPPIPGIDPEPFPTAADLAWLAEVEAREAAEKARIERDYPVDPAYERWLDGLDDALPPRDQVSPDELAQLAGHGCI